MYCRLPAHFIACFLFLFIIHGEEAKDLPNESRRVITLTSGEWPPYLSRDLPHGGLSSYHIRQAFSKVNIDVKFEYYYSWKRAYEESKKGNIDGTCIWQKNDERLKEHFYSDSLLVADYYFIHRKDYNFDWFSLDDIKNIPLGLEIGYYYGEEISRWLKEGKLNVQYAKTEAMNLRKLLMKRVDLVYGPIGVINSSLSSQFTPEECAKLVYHPRVNRRDTWYLLFSKNSKGSEELRDLFNTGLRLLKQELSEKAVIKPLHIDIANSKLSAEEKQLYRQLTPKVNIQPERPIINLRISNGEWPPYQGYNLPEFGFFSKVTSDAFAVEGYQTNFEFLNWNRGFLMAKNGELDGTVSWTYNDERAKSFHYSLPIYREKVVIFSRKPNKASWKKLDDLKNYSFSATRGYFYGEDFAQLEKSGVLKVYRTDSDLIGLKMLIAGQVDLFICDLYVGLHLLKHNFPNETFKKITYYPKSVKADFMHLLLSRKIKNGAQIMESFNRGLIFLKSNGFYDQYREELLEDQIVHPSK